jgi:hypothetical protein
MESKARPSGLQHSASTNYTTAYPILTAVAKKSSVSWDVTLCSTVKFNPRFTGTYRIYLQGRTVRQAGTKQSFISQKTDLHLAESVLLDLTCGLRMGEEKYTKK